MTAELRTEFDKLFKELNRYSWTCCRKTEVEPGLWRECGICSDCKVRKHMAKIPDLLYELEKAAAAAARPATMSRGVDLIAEERAKQMEKYDPHHDSLHTRGELAMAAAQLAVSGTDARVVGECVPGDFWGLIRKNVGHEIKQLRIAGALIAAEIDRRLGERR